MAVSQYRPKSNPTRSIGTTSMPYSCNEAENTHLLRKGKYHCTADLLDSAVLLNWNYKQICLFGQILTSQTGGQPYSDISPYKVSECSLDEGRQKDVLRLLSLFVGKNISLLWNDLAFELIFVWEHFCSWHTWTYNFFNMPYLQIQSKGALEE